VQHWFTYPNWSPIAFHIGNFAVHWYGISYLVGFIAVYLWVSRPAALNRLHLRREQVQDFIFYAVIGVLIGGRALYDVADMIAHHDASTYLSHPIEFIAVWNGGMAFHGGMIGALVAMWLFVRKHPALSFAALGDELVVMVPVGIALTRVVNFVNDELWGIVCNPDRPWCMVPGDTVTWGIQFRHPAQLYEAVLDIATLPVLLLLYRLKPRTGVVAASWFTLYGITRTVAEIWRAGGIPFAGLHGGQLLSVPMIVIGGFFIWYFATRGAPQPQAA
jgi:phosphatidylglycerol---prolipoprotein diacylglyceryl transferase